MPAPHSTGLPGMDAQHDFVRARRRATIAALVARLRGEPNDVGVVLPYEEVIAALGFVGEQRTGLHVVPLDAIVGSVDRTRDYDRRFRPTSSRTRGRWEQIAAAARRGESFPPVDLLRIGELYFVRDGHHRVSVARALGRTDIDAYVTDVKTRIDADRAMQVSDLPLKSHERVFFERVPL
ncbi:MAG: chromosome partitioning protein ParB, partial [Solirubrobacteraceae bacterium]